MRLPTTLALLVCSALAGCGKKEKPAARKMPTVPQASLDDFRPHRMMVRLTGQQAIDSRPPGEIQEIINYTLRPVDNEVVAHLTSLQNTHVEFHQGADMSEMATLFNVPEGTLQEVVNRAFTDPYCKFKLGRHGEEVSRDVVAKRDSIMLLGNNGVGIISLFLAPVEIPDEEWTRFLRLPTSNGITFHGDLDYKARELGPNDDKDLINVDLQGLLTADGKTSVSINSDYARALKEGRPVKRHSAVVDQSKWKLKGFLRYSRKSRQWVSGMVESEVAMRVRTQHQTTVNRINYMLEIMRSSPLEDEEEETADEKNTDDTTDKTEKPVQESK